MLFREVAAAKAHIAIFGNVSQKLEDTAQTNKNPILRERVAGTCVQDRYKHLQSAFDKSDKRDQFRSGVRGKLEKLVKC